jgi:hypothetical protein
MGRDEAAPLSGPAIRQHHQLGTVRSVHYLDDVSGVLGLGEARGFVGHFLLVPKGPGHSVVEDVEALVGAHGVMINDSSCHPFDL